MNKELNQIRDEMLAVHVDIFGSTSLKKRLEDIWEEAHELCDYYSEENLKEEASDLLSSLLCLAAENNWDIQELIQMNYNKMAERRQNGHYKRTGEAAGSISQSLESLCYKQK
jgi:NTP pyrophosphatase (non-canonical NTP hydrolase)